MPAIARIGDMGIGTCACPSTLMVPMVAVTNFVTGAATVTAEGSSVCVSSTMGVGTCGPTPIQTLAQTASGTVFANGQGVHRQGDIGLVLGPCVGTYTVVSGAGTVLAN